MKLNPMPIGARVTIRPSSEYYGINTESNPADEVGVVEQNGEEHDYLVRWLHSDRTNYYRRSDLKYWRGKVEQPKVEKIDEEKLQALIPKAIGECKKKSQNVTARYAFIYQNGQIKVNGNTACHATVMGIGSPEKKKIASIVTCINRGRDDCNEGVAIGYYDWLLNRSPYASAFVTKDARKAHKKDRYVVMDVSVPANLLQGALVATRQTWEHNPVCYTQHKLTQLGVNESVAHLLGCLLRPTRSSPSNLTLSVQGSGHFHIDVHYMSLEDCIRFTSNKPENLEKPYNQGGSVVGVHKMFLSKDWMKRDNFSLSKYARQVANKAGAEGEKATTNPFAAAKRKETETVSAEKLAEYVIAEGIFL